MPTMRLKLFLRRFLIIVMTADLVTWQLTFINAKDIVARTNTSVSANSHKQETANPLGIAIPLPDQKTPPVRGNGRDARLISYYKSGFRFEPDKIKQNDPPVNSAQKNDDQKIIASDRTAWKLGRGANVQKSQPWAVHYASSEETDSKEAKTEASSEEVSDSSAPKTSNSKDDAHVIWTPNQGAVLNPWDGALSHGQQVWINGELVSQPGHPVNLQPWNLPAPPPDIQGGTTWDDAPGDDAVVEEWPNDADGDDEEAEWKEVGGDDEAVLNGGGWDQGGKPVNGARKQQGWNGGRPQWPPKPGGNNIQWKMYNENTQTMHDIDEASGWKVIGDGSDGWKVIDADGKVEWTIQNVNGEWRVSNEDEWKNDESTEEPYTTPATEEPETTEMTETTTSETTESTAMTESMTTDEITENTASTESTTTITTEMMTTTEDMSDETDKSEEEDKSDEDKSYQDKNYEDKKKRGKYIVWKFKDNGQGEAKLYGGGGEPDVWTIGDNAWWPPPDAAGWNAGNGGWYISNDGGYGGPKSNRGDNGENPWKGNGGVKVNGGRKNGENRKGGKGGGYGNGGNGKGNGGKGNGNKYKNNRNGGKNGNGKGNGNGNRGKKKGNGTGGQNGNGNGGKNGNGNGGKKGNGNSGKNGNGNGKKKGNRNGGKYGSWSNGGSKANSKGQNNRPKGNGWQGKRSNGGRPGNGGNKPYSKRNSNKNGGQNNGWKPSNQGWSAPDTSYQNGGKTKSNGNSQGTPYVIIIKTSNAKSKSNGGRNPWVPSRTSNKGYPRPKSNRRQSNNGWQWDPNAGTIGGLQWMESWISAQSGLTADKNTVYTNWRPTKINPPTGKHNGTNIWHPPPTPVSTATSADKKKPSNSKGKQIIIIDYASKNTPKGENGMKQDIEKVLKVLKSTKPTGIKGHWPRST